MAFGNKKTKKQKNKLRDSQVKNYFCHNRVIINGMTTSSCTFMYLVFTPHCTSFLQVFQHINPSNSLLMQDCFQNPKQIFLYHLHISSSRVPNSGLGLIPFIQIKIRTHSTGVVSVALLKTCPASYFWHFVCDALNTSLRQLM